MGNGTAEITKRRESDKQLNCADEEKKNIIELL